jgi:hypothetical protein
MAIFVLVQFSHAFLIPGLEHLVLRSHGLQLILLLLKPGFQVTLLLTMILDILAFQIDLCSQFSNLLVIL